MARVFITGSSDGLGLTAAKLLIEQGHEVVVHGRNEGRSRDALLAAAGAQGAVTGDLSTIAGATTAASEVNKLGRFNAIIHNAGIGYRETRRVETEPGAPSIFAVNVLAPYILTALIERPDRLVYGLCQLRHAPRRAAEYRRPALDQARLERLVGLRGEQALRCSARICRRPALEERPIQRAGAWMGADEDGRPFSSGRSSPRVCNPGVARHKRRCVGAIDGRVFLSSAPSRAERDRERHRDSGGVTRRMRPHLRYPPHRLIPALRLGERRPARSRTSPKAFADRRVVASALSALSAKCPSGNYRIDL